MLGCQKRPHANNYVKKKHASNVRLVIININLITPTKIEIIIVDYFPREFVSHYSLIMSLSLLRASKERKASLGICARRKSSTQSVSAIPDYYRVQLWLAFDDSQHDDTDYWGSNILLPSNTEYPCVQCYAEILLSLSSFTNFISDF